MKALLLEGPNAVRVGTVSSPKLGPGDMLLRVNACGVCVSDVHKIRYRTLTKPTVLGHEIAGTVAQVGREVKRFRQDDRVVVAHHVPCLTCHYCRHENYSMCPQFKESALDPGGFSEFVRIPAMHIQSVAFRIPDSLGDPEASFMEPLACCLRNIKRVRVRKGDAAVIIGLGSIGILMAQLVKAFGGASFGLDLDPARCRLAESFGARAYAATSNAFHTRLKEETAGRGADVVIFTAGTPALMKEALGWLRDGGTLNLFASFHPESQAPFDWNPLYYREINVVASYSPSPADLAESLALLADGKVQVKALAQHRFPLHRFQEALDSLEKRLILKAIMVPHADN